jgi:hypothetical protein
MSAQVSVPAIALGLALLVAYWVWLWAFFAKVRPRIMAALGRRLRVKVAESTGFLDAGTYNVDEDDAPVAKHGAVWGADIALTVAGTVGVAALVFVPAFLVADSGMLLPLEAKLTGRGATIAAPPESPWPAGGTRADLVVAVTNTGGSDLARCRVRTADYRARDGYLNGATPFVDLPVGSTRRMTLPLAARGPLVADTDVRLKLECAEAWFASASVLLVPR